MAITRRFPDPDRIQINESDLVLKFREFGDALRGRVSPLDLLIIAPAWIPVFASEFIGFAGISGEEIRGFYIALLSLVTIAWFFTGRNSFRTLWERYTPFAKNEGWLSKHETDPQKKVASIREACHKKSSLKKKSSK